MKNIEKKLKLITNGFTLIELLAVIVILAIIALIATPIILGIIKDTKEQTKEINAKNYLNAVEQAIVRENMKGIFIATECNIEGGEVKCVGYDKPLNVEIEGEVPIRGTIYISDGKVAPNTSLEYKNGDNPYINTEGKLIFNKIEKVKTYNNGEEVYIDVTTGKSCTNYHEDNSKTGYNGLQATKTTDNQNSCLKFYAFLDDGSKNLNLLLDHNTTAQLAWTTSEITTNANGPVDVINQLKTDTNEWVGTITPTKYEYKGTARQYTINYSEYKARLITAQEIAQITGADKLLSWDETSTTSAWYYLDGAKTNETVPNWQTQVANSTNKSDYYWLFDRTYGCTSYGCQVADGSTYGYWTSSAHASSSNRAWRVYLYGTLDNTNVHNTSHYGVRPVITILKSNI